MQTVETTNFEPTNTGSNGLLVAEPVQAQERIEVLDVIRGFALLGILIVNMAMFNTPFVYLEVLGKSMWTAPWDTITNSFVNIFVQGKFYTMFAFLFGLGFVIFLERAQAKTLKPRRLFFRRLLILLCIGLIHAFFIWCGDVLVTYALLGFLLPLFFGRSLKTIFAWIVVLLSGLILLTGIGALSTFILDEAAFAALIEPMRIQMEAGVENSLLAYGQGGFAAIMAQRASDTLFGYSQLFAAALLILPLFLLGVYAGKKAIFQNIETNLTFFKKAWTWGLIIGLTMSIVRYWSAIHVNHLFPSFYDVIHVIAKIAGDTGLSVFYMATIVLLFQNKKRMLCLKPLGYVGRMALSNYLLQSIICTMIFYNYGLGFYGQVGTTLGLVLTIAVFAIQIIISKYWLKHYQFGPMEWLWKSFTYGKRFKNKQKS